MILPLFLLAGLARAADVSPAAGSVVRSKEWIVRRGKEREEEFVGDVRYQSAGTTLFSDWALYRHATKDWKARGHVGLRKELEGGDVIEAKGEHAVYDEKTKDGSLLPEKGRRVRFTRVPSDGSGADEGEGARLDWESDRAATLAGGARVWGPRLDAWADSARYERPQRKLILTGGRPVLRKVDEEGGWTTALKADQITATDQPRTIIAHGAVKGWLKFNKEEKLKELSK